MTTRSAVTRETRGCARPFRALRRRVLAGTLILLAAGGACAADFLGTKALEHGCPWLEMKQPDVHTVFLWKFSSEADRNKEAGALLDKGDLGELLETKSELTEGLGEAKKGVEPKLTGDAKLEAGAGRFGGGLDTDGNGFAEGAADLPALLAADGGFTLDFWFRPVAQAANSTPETLLALCDLRAKPFVTIVKAEPARVLLTSDGKERLSVPLAGGTGQWHHLVLILERNAAMLRVDGEEATAEPQDWFKNLLRRLGSKVTAGGAPGQPGWRGVVDEVRLAKGVQYLYPWKRGEQERDRRSEDLALKAPFFKSGKVLTRFRFDGNLKPEVFAGLSWTGNETAAYFQPGVQGQALDLSHIDKSGFKMNGYDILPATNGTVEFWFRPLNWNNFFVGDYTGSNLKYDWLLTLTGKDLPPYSPLEDIEVFRGRAGRDADLRWQQFHPGTWTHVLITQKDGHEDVYLNGQRQKLAQVAFVFRREPHVQEALNKWRERTGGKDDGAWTLAFKPSPTLVDELSVYSWAMSAEEAWNAYARWLPDAAAQMKPLPTFRADFDYVAHSWDLQEKLVSTLVCLPVGETKPASADIEIRAESAGDPLLKLEKQPLDDAGNATFTLKQALPFGRYPVTVRSRDATGAVLKEEKIEYVRQKPDWFGNTLGKERSVPKPWTPVTTEGRKLGVIGRTIELGANGLPARIETIQQQLLAAPVTICIATPAGRSELTGPGPVMTENAPDRVAWQAKLAGAGLTADLDAWMEFDGLLYCAVTLNPAAGTEAKLDGLDIDFPLNPQLATQLLANGGGNDFRASWISKYVPPGPGSVWNSLEKPYPAFCRVLNNFMPHIWLGGDDAGLYFGGENDKGWTVDGPKPAQEILRENGAVVFRMHVIREATAVGAEGRRFHFVLLPTPAKPEPPDWRKQIVAGGVNFGSCDSFGGFDMKTDPADPGQGDSFLMEPHSWEHAAEMAPQSRAKWGRCILYADASWPRPGAAFRDWNHDLWAGTGRIAWTPEFEDYVVWVVNEYIKRGIIDGIYWDDVSVGYTLSLASTAYAYAGSANGRRVGFTALAQRRANMRLWRLFEAAGREPCIWAHMTVCYEVPLFSFCRYLSNGEFVTGVNFPGTRDAMDFWSPDTLRILGSSTKWGTGVSFLSTLPRSLPATAAARQWAYPQNRTEAGLYITSDIMTLPGLVEKLNQERVFNGPVRALPWWKADEVLKIAAPTNAQMLACVYVLDGRAIVAVASRDRGGEHDIALDIDAGRLFPGARGVVWRDLDPGLKPPKEVAASAKDIKAVAASIGGDPGGEKPTMDDAALGDLLNGTTPEEREQQRLRLRTDGNTARMVIRPRDYRVLEAKPVR